MESTLGKHIKITHIPNPVPIHEFNTDKKETQATITILGSSYRNSKNSAIGAQAILELKRELPQLKFRLQIVGEPFPELSDIAQFCLPPESSSEATRQFLEQSDILIYTSKSDNLPNFVLEAQAAGNAVIAFKKGGIPECFIPNVTGYLVDEHQEEIVTALRRIVTNRKARLDMSRAARSHVAEKHSFQLIGEEYTSLYQSIIHKD
jgi:glycosyltransferase involved in cell wall biosynthesis